MIADYFHALTGWRCWDAWANGLLCAQAVYDPWPPRHAHHARCACIAETSDAMAHVKDGRWQAAPVFDCHCGIYAHKSSTRAQDRFREGRDRHWHGAHGDRVWGMVKLWGRVIEHTEGYRAEYAYPAELWSNNEAIAAQVALLYGVPCTYEAPIAPFEDAGGDYFKGLPLTQATYNTALASYTTVAHTFWRNQAPTLTWPTTTQWQWSPTVAPSSNPSMIPLTGGAIRIPSPSIVKALGGSRYQQQTAVQKIATAHDWRAVLKQGFHALRNNDDADAMTITGATT